MRRRAFLNVLKKKGGALIPVDSEHNALFQMGAGDADVEKIILTASGGPFRTCLPSDLSSVTPQEAMRHPVWKMGRKISIDSANLMNKSLELIEAHYLFGLEVVSS